MSSSARSVTTRHSRTARRALGRVPPRRRLPSPPRSRRPRAAAASPPRSAQRDRWNKPLPVRWRRSLAGCNAGKVRDPAEIAVPTTTSAISSSGVQRAAESGAHDGVRAEALAVPHRPRRRRAVRPLRWPPAAVRDCQAGRSATNRCRAAPGVAPVACRRMPGNSMASAATIRMRVMRRVCAQAGSPLR